MNWCPWLVAELAVAQTDALPQPTSLKEVLYGIVTLGGVMVLRELTWWAGKAKETMARRNGNGGGKDGELLRELVAGNKQLIAVLERLAERSDSAHDMLVRIQDRQHRGNSHQDGGI